MSGLYYQHKYGIKLPLRLSDRLVEGLAYSRGILPENGGLGPTQHFKNYIFKTWPKAEETWHPWAEWRFQCLTDPEIGVTKNFVSGSTFRNISWTGAASSGKTHSASLFAIAWWSVAPAISTVMLCSSSKQRIRQRCWPVVQDFYHTSQDNGQLVKVGHLVDSQTKIQSEKGDDKHAMFAIAVEQGELQRAIGLIKGIHAQRIALIVDEADSTPPAIFETIPNLRKACKEFVLLTIGNAVSPLDAHGQVCEPKGGWDTVSVETEQWETKGVDKWNIEPGVCLHFDGTKSPNVKAGRTKWPFIYTFEDYLSAQAKPEYSKSIQYWSMERGFWAPEGAVDRVITPQMIIRYQAKERFLWRTTTKTIGALDPAFGGNACILTFGVIGDTDQHATALEMTEQIEIQPEAKSNLPIDHQIARRVIRECEARGVQPNCFGLDATGIGRGVAAILRAEWSSDVIAVEFGGQASDTPFAEDDNRPAKEVCVNRVTELWWRVRDIMVAGRLRGLNDATCQELCSRPYEMAGKRYRVLPKDKCKQMVGKSPDRADSAAVLCEVALKHGLAPAKRISQRDRVEHAKLNHAANEVWEVSGGMNDKVPIEDAA